MAGKSTSSRSRSSASSATTIDHEEIRQWAESRGGKPACVKGTGGNGDMGLLRIEFRDDNEEALHAIEWDDFFEKFDEQGLALVYQEKTSGGQRSRFNKLISRDNSDAAGGGSASRGAAGKKSARRPGTQSAKSAAGKNAERGGGSSRKAGDSSPATASKEGGKSTAKAAAASRGRSPKRTAAKSRGASR